MSKENTVPGRGVAKRMRQSKNTQRATRLGARKGTRGRISSPVLFPEDSLITIMKYRRPSARSALDEAQAAAFESTKLRPVGNCAITSLGSPCFRFGLLELGYRLHVVPIWII